MEYWPGGSGTRKWPAASVVNDVTTTVSLTTSNATLASGAESVSPSRAGPPWVGLIEITPSIPVEREPGCACIEPVRKGRSTTANTTQRVTDSVPIMQRHYRASDF